MALWLEEVVPCCSVEDLEEGGDACEEKGEDLMEGGNAGDFVDPEITSSNFQEYVCDGSLLSEKFAALTKC